MDGEGLLPKENVNLVTEVGLRLPGVLWVAPKASLGVELRLTSRFPASVTSGCHSFFLDH